MSEFIDPHGVMPFPGARMLGPDHAYRLAFRQVSGGELLGVPGKSLVVFADEGGTVLADIAHFDGTSGVSPWKLDLVIDEDSFIPFFWFPPGSAAVYVKIGQGSKLTRVIALSPPVFRDP